MNAQMKYTDSQCLSSDVRFYTITDVMKMTGWGEKAVQNMFNDPEFPCSDFGRTRIVESHALIQYFSVRRTKEDKAQWLKGELSNELKKRIG